MHKRRPGDPGRVERYWRRRVRSPAFRRALTALLTRELHALSRERVRDVLDPDLVRATIREWGGKIFNRQIVADMVIEVNRRAAARLKKQRASVLGMLDTQLVADLDALLEEDIRLSRHAEDFVSQMMQQEFVRCLFTDIIFTSIVSFHERVNPFFGGITVRLLQEQIKGFIDLFMPMLQEQAAAFAVDKENQRILLDFTRSIIRHLLDEPLAHYAVMVSSGQKRKVEALVRNAIADLGANAKMDKLVREMALALWEGVYRTIRDKRVGELLQLDEHVGWLAKRSVAAIMPVLSRPAMVQFVAAEFTLAATKQR